MKNLKVQKLNECRCETCRPSLLDSPGISITAIALLAVAVMIAGILWAVNV